MKSMGLGLESVPFHFEWDIVEWNLQLSEKLIDLGVNLVEILEIWKFAMRLRREAELFGPQIEIDLENVSDLGEPPVEAAGEAPSVMEIGDEPSVEGKVVEELGTGDSPVRRMEAGDSFFKDYPGDAFEKVGEINLEETPQTL